MAFGRTNVGFAPTMISKGILTLSTALLLSTFAGAVSDPYSMDQTALTDALAAHSYPFYPDPSLTQGTALAVATDSICVAGYSKTIRFVPLPEKRAVYRSYGLHSGRSPPAPFFSPALRSLMHNFVQSAASHWYISFNGKSSSRTSYDPNCMSSLSSAEATATGLPSLARKRNCFVAAS